MYKRKLTAMGAYELFVEEYGREPEKEEFIELGYGRSSYYRARKQYEETKEAERYEQLREEMANNEHNQCAGVCAM